MEITHLKDQGLVSVKWCLYLPTFLKTEIAMQIATPQTTTNLIINLSWRVIK